jgi:LysR family hydrogen peroxide-inducible transcriptional activator
MNFNQLEYLRELYSSGSFSTAAEKLGITQPALSLQIQKLEEELGFKLVDRTRRPLKLTEEGTVFYHKSIEILRQVDNLKDLSLELGDQIKGNLKTGIIPTVSPYLIPLFIQNLKKSYPALTIEVFEMKTEEIIDELKLGKLDCGIISTPVSSAGIQVQTLFYERFYAYVSPKHVLAPVELVSVDQLNEEDIWYLEEGNCFQNQVNSICKINTQKKTDQQLIYRSSSIESLRRIVEHQTGITFIPELATIDIPAEQEDLVKELSGDQPVREISAVTVKSSAKERQVTALIEVIKNSVPKRMLSKPMVQVADPALKIK